MSYDARAIVLLFALAVGGGDVARLSIRLLGSFQVTLDGEAAVGFRSDKVRALLAYLCVELEAPHRREKLAGLLWPEWPERAARTNLRQVIGDRTSSGDRTTTPPSCASPGKRSDSTRRAMPGLM
jgi:hypothetical protein